MPLPYRHIRHDYLAIYEAGGASALNEVLRERYPDPEIRSREILRMAKSRYWEIGWDAESDEYRVLGRGETGSRNNGAAPLG